MVIEMYNKKRNFVPKLLTMRIASTIFIVLLASVLLLSANTILSSLNIIFHENAFVNSTLKYQLFALAIAMLILIGTLHITPESKGLLHVGNLDSPAIKEKWLGINGKTSWRKNGFQLAFFISTATGIFMFLSVKYTNNLDNFMWSYLPIILIISFTNSFSEEMIYRFAINGNLITLPSNYRIYIISAILFGLPHYQGYPSGILGVIMAGALGYILSKATHETKGIAVAWGIHFLQDIIIFTSLFMMNVRA